MGRPGRDKSDLLIEGERIGALGTAGELSAEVIEDVDGLWALPGVIDAHVHPIHNETFESIGVAAAYGGVTTVLHHVYPQRGESTAESVLRAIDGSRRAPADVGFHIRLTADRIDEHFDNLPQPGVVSFKVFLAHSDPRVTCSLADLYKAARRAAAIDLALVVHAELGDIVERARLDQPAPNDLAGLDAQRPASLEAAAISAVGAIAAITRAHVYVAHVSSGLALSAACAAKEGGARLSVETCPHYLFLTHDSPLGGLGKVAPPLRSTADRVALRKGVSSGAIDVIASDHCGYTQAEKVQDDVANSGNGLPGVEQMLPLLLDSAIRAEWLTEIDLVRVACTGPARIFRLSGKGQLSSGFDADIVLIDPSGSQVVEHRSLHDGSFYSPYEGRTLRGRIVRVIRRGVTLVDHGVIGEPSGGRPVRLAPG
jgi:dihydropyrimidinase